MPQIRSSRGHVTANAGPQRPGVPPPRRGHRCPSVVLVPPPPDPAVRERVCVPPAAFSNQATCSRGRGGSRTPESPLLGGAGGKPPPQALAFGPGAGRDPGGDPNSGGTQAFGPAQSHQSAQFRSSPAGRYAWGPSGSGGSRGGGRGHLGPLQLCEGQQGPAWGREGGWGWREVSLQVGGNGGGGHRPLPLKSGGGGARRPGSLLPPPPQRGMGRNRPVLELPRPGREGDCCRGVRVPRPVGLPHSVPGGGRSSAAPPRAEDPGAHTAPPR